MVVPLPKSKPTYRGPLPTSKPAPTARNETAAKVFSDLQKQLSGRGPRTPVFTPPRKGSRPIAKLYNELTPLEQEARDKQGIESLKGFAVGLPAGLLGLPADLAALIFRDAPQLAAKLVTGQELKVEERTFIDKLVGDFQRAAGAEAIMEKMGFGEDLLPEEDEKGQPVNLATDALSQAGVTPFRAGSLIGEAIAPIPTGAGIARLLGRRSTDAGEVLPAERVEPTISTTSDEPGEIIEGSVVERLTGPVDEAAVERATDFETVLPDEGPRTNVTQIMGDASFRQLGDYEEGMARVDTGALDEAGLIARFEELESDIRQTQVLIDDAVSIGEPIPNNLATLRQAHEDDIANVRNELIGRRDGHYVQLTDEEATAPLMAAFPVEDVEMPEELLNRIDSILAKEPDGPDLPMLDVTDTNANIIPGPDEGFQGLPGGVGSLDESMPIYGNYNLTIGGMPDEFKGSVTHYSPTMTNFQNFVGSNAFARQAPVRRGDNQPTLGGKLEARQWLAALSKNPTSSQKIGTVEKEIKGSEFENIMKADESQKYSQTEIRRLLTSRLPQTRVRTFLESNHFDEINDGTSPFNTYSRMHFDEQYRREDLNSARDKGVVVFSNTAPTINVPGFGRMKPKALHDYYGNYPGYYGHGRFIIVERQDGKKFLQINEIQSNSISNISSGSEAGYETNMYGETVRKYVKKLEDRLEAWREGREDVRIPYNEEVHKIFKEVEDLKPEVVRREDILSKSIQENEQALETLKNDIDYKFSPKRMLDPENSYGEGAEYVFGPKAYKGLLENDALIAQALLPDDPADFNVYVKNMSDIFADILDSQGVAYPARVLDALVPVVKTARDRLADGNLPSFDKEMMREIIDIDSADYIDDSARLKADLENTFAALPEIEKFKLMLRYKLRDNAKYNYQRALMKDMLAEDKTFLKIVDDLPEDKKAKLFGNTTSARTTATELADEQNEIIDKIYNDFSTGPTKDNLVRRLEEENIAFEGEGTFGLFDPDVIYSRADAEDIYIKSTIGSLLRSDNGRSFLNGVSLTERVNDLNKATVELVRQAAEIAPEAATARQGWRDALSDLPNKEDVATLLEIAKKTEESGGTKGFQSAEPYNNDADFYKFATRAIIKEAEKLDLDGVIIPDAAYLATQPQRRPNDAFLRNYGRVIDEELSELTKADENAGVGIQLGGGMDIKDRVEDPLIAGNSKGFEVDGVDPNNFELQGRLQPFKDEKNNAEREFKALRKKIDDLEKKLAAAEKRASDAPDDQDIADEVIRLQDEMSDVDVDLREARDRRNNVKDALKRETDRNSTRYNSNLRIVEFDNDANKQLARRPIRRAAGGMVRSGIGAMAREVM